MYQQCQHVAYPGSCKSCFSRIPVFGRKVLLIFILSFTRWLICIIGQPDLINPLISADSCPAWHIYSLWGLLFQFHGLLALKSDWDKMCFFLAHIDSVDIQITFNLNLSCLNQSSWWLCRRFTKSTTPWWIRSGLSMSN